LLTLKDFSLSSDYVSKRLGITEEQAASCIDKLKNLKLIVEDGGKWKPTQRKITTEIDVPSLYLRKSHEEKMKLSIERMHEVDLELRDYSSITFPADPQNIATAKKMLIDFRRSLAERMKRGYPSEVYLLNLQLFPLTRSNQREFHE
jgi:uncharacterized protein (TIGR02147 family)